jgi:hypothetical protein
MAGASVPQAMRAPRATALLTVRADGGDAPLLDQELARLDQLALVHVEQAGAAEVDGRRRGATACHVAQITGSSLPRFR